ncbi:MAG TPA: hypothetical protein VK694_00675 [Verrucomicrobiae bacterium]|nr:hypothetical protein [Verrucomicrobiae bacterium]
MRLRRVATINGVKVRSNKSPHRRARAVRPGIRHPVHCTPLFSIFTNRF